MKRKKINKILVNELQNFENYKHFENVWNENVSYRQLSTISKQIFKINKLNVQCV